jgi:hypothetical protein
MSSFCKETQKNDRYINALSKYGRCSVHMVPFDIKTACSKHILHTEYLQTDGRSETNTTSSPPEPIGSVLAKTFAVIEYRINFTCHLQ